MVFSSSSFIFVFLPLVVLLYYNPFIKSRTYRNIILLIFSYGFYAYGEPIYILLMLLSITVNWIMGILVGRKDRYGKLYVGIAVIYNIGMLFWFKYINFFAENLGLLLHTEFPLKEVVLPIGISFYSFQALSYVIDVYKDKAYVQRSWMKLGLYVSCFPQLIAGPIVRYHTVAEEINHRNEKFQEFMDGLTRFAYGLSKKVIIANSLAVVADYAFGQQDRSVLLAWEGMLAYTLQIYHDFSGYSDMAIGLGMMFGFHFPENFNYPYISKSITEFWRRWHMSLTTWFRDYIYIPLGGNRVSKRRHFVNLLIVWLFTGLWHGAAWTFIFWGLFYFVLQVVEKKTGFPEKMGNVFSRVYTLLFVMIGWVFFRSEGMGAAAHYIGQLFGLGVKGLTDGMALHYLTNYIWYFLIGIAFSAPLFKVIKRWCDKKKGTGFLFQLGITAVFIITIGFVLRSEYDPFIYFNF